MTDVGKEVKEFLEEIRVELELLREENARLKVDLDWERGNYLSYRKALDAIYNENEVARAAVVKHHGTCHTPPIPREASYFEEAERELTKLRTLLAKAHKTFLLIEKNFDCDRDAHKYQTPCRACQAGFTRQEIDASGVLK